MLKWLQDLIWGPKEEKTDIQKSVIKSGRDLGTQNKWKKGKTSHSIKFIEDVEKAIVHLNGIVDLIKDGRLILTKSWTVGDVYDISKFNEAIKTCGQIVPTKPKRKVILVPVELDVDGWGWDHPWGVVRDFETKELLGFTEINGEDIVDIGPDENPCEPFEIEVIGLGD